MAYLLVPLSSSDLVNPSTVMPDPSVYFKDITLRNKSECEMIAGRSLNTIVSQGVILNVGCASMDHKECIQLISLHTILNIRSQFMVTVSHHYYFHTKNQALARTS